MVLGVGRWLFGSCCLDVVVFGGFREGLGSFSLLSVVFFFCVSLVFPRASR